ncbi:MAG: hypothetical protein ACK452_14570 [Bacteroidota bacterium]
MKTKSLFITILTCIFFFSLTPQNITAAFEIEKMNVVYIGIDNTIKIVSVNKIDSITFNREEANLNNLDKSNDGKCITANLTANSITTQGQELKINIWSNGNTVDTKYLRVRRLPDPNLNLFGIESGANIDKSKLRILLDGNNVVFVKKPIGLDLEIEYQIMKWTILIFSKGGAENFEGTGSKLSSEAKEKIGKVNKGDKIAIEAVLRAPDFSLRTCSAGYIIK